MVIAQTDFQNLYNQPGFGTYDKSRMFPISS